MNIYDLFFVKSYINSQIINCFPLKNQIFITLKLTSKKDCQFRYSVDWIIVKINLNNMASFPFGLKMWYNIIICYKRKYSFSYKLKGTTCKILNVLEGRRERRNERSDHFLHSFVETVLESFWITRYMQIRFDLLTYFKTKIPTCYLALNFQLSLSLSLSLSLRFNSIMGW